MPERMRIDVGQIVAAGKIVKPAGDTVRVHITSDIRREHKTGVLPPVTMDSYHLTERLPVIRLLAAKGFFFSFDSGVTYFWCFAGIP